MVPDTEPTTARPGDVTLQEIDNLLDEVSRLSLSESTPHEFHLELLDRAVRALAAVGGAVWTRSGAGDWHVDSRVDLTRNRIIESLAGRAAHRELLQSVVDSNEGRIVLPNAALAAGESPNPTEFLLIVSPMAIEEDGGVTGILEVAQRAGGSPAQHHGYLRLLEALCELAVDFHRQRRVRVLQAVAGKAQEIDRFGLAVHASLDLPATACTIVNEGRRLLDCDRFSLAVRRGRHMRIVAVSGSESVDRRANIVQRLEDLTNAVALTGEPFWAADDAAAIPPQIARPLEAWRDESHARNVAVIPLAAPGGAAGRHARPGAQAAVIVERFGGDRMDDAFRLTVGSVCAHAELALRNALEHESFPFYKLLRIVRKARWFVAARQLPKTAAVALLLAAAGLALAYVPANFEIEGRGLLQPSLRRNVFARSDGIITEVRAEHSQQCREGDTLAVMTRSQLDYDLTRVLGELATSRQRLSGVQATRLKLNPQTAADRDKYNQLTAEETEIRESLKSLEQQHEILKAQQDDLLVRSPLTGAVVTWNVKQLLEARPVQKGQTLMQVADLSGPWVLEVEVSDDRIGHVLDARRSADRDLGVSFMLATEAGTSYRGTIENISLATDVRPPEQAHVLVTVRINRDEIRGLRPGATAVTRIHCGRRSIGFVWFHSLWETIQKKVLF
ncbi:MAG: HlyD family efflux transporter periplasmic adaptor subunit [Planctomycetia bacterium]|nr:HlyD family efflux transporter periplasmic adaptor subunit [Planctomycetia bacterium]